MALDELQTACAGHACHAERIIGGGLGALRIAAADGVVDSVLPHLLVISADAAWADDGALLRAFKRNQPWMFVPRVVVSEVESVELCDATYDEAAGWVVLTPGAEGAEGVEIFLEYWLHGVLLPGPRSSGPRSSGAQSSGAQSSGAQSTASR